jgi:hypothetical protein
MSVGPNLASVSDDPDTERCPVPCRFLEALKVSLTASPVQFVPHQIVLLRSIHGREDIGQHLKCRPPLVVRKISVANEGNCLAGLVGIVREQFKGTAQERQLWRRSIVHRITSVSGNAHNLPSFGYQAIKLLGVLINRMRFPLERQVVFDLLGVIALCDLTPKAAPRLCCAVCLDDYLSALKS